MTSNTIIFVHGMVSDGVPLDHQKDYDDFWAGVLAARPDYSSALGSALNDHRLRIEWGHESETEAQQPNPGELRPDQRIRRAENTIHCRVAQAVVSNDTSPHNHLHSESEGVPDWLARQTLRPVMRTVREDVGIYGVGDVVYYCSKDGERAVRTRVYSQVLDWLARYRNSGAVGLHVIGHSLGVTVTFDFLFGLFASADHWDGDKPDFVRDTETTDPQLAKDYLYWRGRAHDRTLRLASLTSTASQLPLTVMRKQTLVDQLARGDKLDPSVIGIDPTGPVVWKMFYDQDDVLGFPTRMLFNDCAAIDEYEVNTGISPVTAHSGYWRDPVVAREVAELIHGRLGG